MSLAYAESLDLMPADRYFTEYGNGSIIYKKTYSPFSKEAIMYMSFAKEVLMSTTKTPPSNGLYYLTDIKGNSLNEYITQEEPGWVL